MGDLLFTMTKKETKDSLVFLNKKYAHFKDDEIVEVRIAGTRAQIKSSGFKTPKGHMSIQRKGDDLINTNTGEVIQYKKYNKRIDNIKGIRKSLDDLYWLIAANVHMKSLINLILNKLKKTGEISTRTTFIVIIQMCVILQFLNRKADFTMIEKVIKYHHGTSMSYC